MDVKWLFKKNTAGKTGLNLTFDIVSEALNDTDRRRNYIDFLKKRTAFQALYGFAAIGGMTYNWTLLDTPIEKMVQQGIQKSAVEAYHNSHPIRNGLIGGVGTPLTINLLAGALGLGSAGKRAHKIHQSGDDFTPETRDM